MNTQKSVNDHGFIPLEDQNDHGFVSFGENNTAPQIESDTGQRLHSFFKGMGKGLPQSQANEMQQGLKESIPGGLQGILNIPGDTVNIFRSNTVPRFNFAPNTESSRFTEEVAPFFAPTALEKMILSIPKIGNAITKFASGLKKMPALNALAKAGKSGAEVGYINALEHPENAREAGLEGLEIGTPVSLATQLATHSNPLISLASRLGLGYGIGNLFGHPYAGATLAAGIPLKALLGLESREDIAQDMLKGLTEKDILKSKNANARLGTSATPAQTSANPVVGGREGRLRTTEEGAQLGHRYDELQKHEQGNAIKRMLDKIYNPTPANEKQISDLYKKANPVKVTDSLMDLLKQDPIIEKQIAQLRANPQFKDVSENTYQFLSQVKRDLDHTYSTLSSSAVGSDRVLAKQVEQSRDYLNDFLKSNNADYKAASKAAQPRIVRRNIEEKLNKEEEDFTAKNFYSRLLNSRKSYRELLRDTKNFPEAQAMIKDMRAGWKNFSNIESVSSGSHTAKKGLDQMRDFIQAMKTHFKNIAGMKADTKRLEYIYRKDWQNDFDRLAKIADQSKRNKAMIETLTKMGTAYGLSSDEVKNLLSAMTDSNEK